MYYLLGYKLLSKYPEDYGENFSWKTSSKTKLSADRTFILTVDGDVQFEPDSVQQLVTELQRDSNVGVACGRIHPMGSGDR